MAEVTINYYAGAAHAAGRSSEQLAAATLGELLDAACATHGRALEAVIAASSFLIDGTSCKDRSASLTAGVTVDVLPPFAGG